MKQRFSFLRQDKQGQNMVEYALIAAFVASCIVAISPAITSTSDYFRTAVHILSLAIAQTSGN